MSVPKDFLGRDIAIGATVVYPSRVSSSMWLNKARVVNLRLDGSKWVLDVERTDNSKKRVGKGVPVERTVVVA